MRSSNQHRMDRFLVKFSQNFPTKLSVFYQFLAKLAPKIPTKSVDFSANLFLKIPLNLTFFSATYQKPSQLLDHQPRVFNPNFNIYILLTVLHCFLLYCLREFIVDQF